MGFRFVDTTEQVIDTLGEEVEYTSAAGGAPFCITGIFDSGYRSFDAGGVVVESNTVELGCKSSDLNSPTRGDTVEVRGVIYTVREVRPDSEGLTTLILTEPT